MHIRPALSTDAQRLLEIRWDAIMNLADEFGYAAAKHWADSASSDRTSFAIAHNSVWVAAFDSLVVGWIEVKVAKVKGLYVRPSSSRSGVGSILMAHAESAIQAQGEVALHLDASPNALPFYARLGYEVAGDLNLDSSVPMVKCFEKDA